MRQLCLSRISRSTAAHVLLFTTARAAYYVRGSGLSSTAAHVLLFTIAFGSASAVPSAYARTSQEKLSQARAYYAEAEKQRADLQDMSATERTAKDYLKVIHIYRLVYLTTPASAQSPKSFMAIGDLYQGMAINLQRPKYFGLAIQAYDFLLQEYPYSQYQEDALLAIGQIYQSDLKQPQEARKRFETYLQKYPKSSGAVRARQALAQMDADVGDSGIGNRESAEPRVPSPQSPVPSPESRVPNPESRVPSLEIRAARSGPRVLISNVREWEMPGATRIVVDLAGEVEGGDGAPAPSLARRGRSPVATGEVKYEVGQVPNPPRVFLDLYGTKISRKVTRAVHHTATGSSLVKGLRAAQYQPDVTRIVAEVDPETDYSVFDLPNPYRLVLEVHKSRQSGRESAGGRESGFGIRDSAELRTPTPESRLPTPEPRTASPESPTPSPEPRVPSPEPRVPNPESRVHAALPNRNGTRSLTRALGLKIGRIILDPGHGGHDTGTIGPSGFTEKELVLDVALRLGKLLSDRLGSDVIFTRDDDTFIPLETRTAIANEKQADLFLSIHANSSPSRSARGIETYYLSFATDPAALEVAARENAVSQESVHELQDLVKKIALHEKVDESKEFATEVQSALHDRLARENRLRKDRGVKKAPFMVLVGARMPSVLAEIAFLSNPQEEKLLKTKQQRQKIAEALYAGVAKYAETLSGVKVARAGGPSSEITKDLPK